MDESTSIFDPLHVVTADIFERGDYLQLESTVWSDGTTTYRARKRSTRFTEWSSWYDSDKEGWPRNNVH